MILTSLLATGCDDRATRIAREAADRQAQQNLAMAELNQEVARGTRSLVAAAAESRRNFAGLHHDLQQERQRLDLRRDRLDDQQRQINTLRHRASLLVPLLPFLGTALMVALLLAFCWRVMGVAQREEPTLAEINEWLLQELSRDRPQPRFDALPADPHESPSQLPPP